MTSLPDTPYSSRPCPRCAGLMQVLIEDDGERVATSELCVNCRYRFVWHDTPMDPLSLYEIADAVDTIREVNPWLCDLCVDKRHRGCTDQTCRCAYPIHRGRADAAAS